MDKKKSYFFDFGIVLGVLGSLSGIYLLSQGDWLIGFFGTISSVFIGYVSYDNKKKKAKNNE